MCGSINSMYGLTQINNFTVFVLLRQKSNLPPVCGPDTNLIGILW